MRHIGPYVSHIRVDLNEKPVKEGCPKGILFCLMIDKHLTLSTTYYFFK